MNDNELLEKAALICLTKHAGQADRVGQAYFQHPMRVAMRCETTEQKIVALLHDTIEDTDVTEEFLLEHGFSEEVVGAVLSVTKREGESYEDFVQRAAQNPIGRVVKLHDLEDNLNVFRLVEVDELMAQRFTKYLAAYRFLKDYEPKKLVSDDILPNSSEVEPFEKSSCNKPITGLTDTLPIRLKSEYFREKRAEMNKNIRNAGRTPKGATNFNKDRLLVTMSDGRVIAEKDAISTFVQVLRHFGFAEVEKVGIMHHDKYPLVARENIDGRYKGATMGWCVLSRCPNALKALYINQLADEFDVPIIAELVAK